MSHAIGKPVANTYKAIAELSRRGAVQIEGGDNRLVRATPVEELLAQLEREEARRREAASSALRDLEPAGPDERIYALATVRQVVERAHAMIGRADRILVADLSPLPFAELRPSLEAAAARGVVVAAKVYAEPDGPASTLDLVRAADPEAVRDAWPGQQLSLVVDAREHLLALLSERMDEVRQAVWSSSTFLSCMHHNHVAMEIEFTRVRPYAERAPAAGSTLLLTARPPGLDDLRGRYAPAGSIPSAPGPIGPEVEEPEPAASHPTATGPQAARPEPARAKKPRGVPDRPGPARQRSVRTKTGGSR